MYWKVFSFCFFSAQTSLLRRSVCTKSSGKYFPIYRPRTRLISLYYRTENKASIFLKRWINNCKTKSHTIFHITRNRAWLHCQHCIAYFEIPLRNFNTPFLKLVMNVCVSLSLLWVVVVCTANSIEQDNNPKAILNLSCTWLKSRIWLNLPHCEEKHSDFHSIHIVPLDNLPPVFLLLYLLHYHGRPSVGKAGTLTEHF